MDFKFFYFLKKFKKFENLKTTYKRASFPVFFEFSENLEIENVINCKILNSRLFK